MTQTVLLTGASQGMGKSVAKFLSEKGANIIIVARDVKKMEDALQLVQVCSSLQSPLFDQLPTRHSLLPNTLRPNGSTSSRQTSKIQTLHPASLPKPQPGTIIRHQISSGVWLEPAIRSFISKRPLHACANK